MSQLSQSVYCEPLQHVHVDGQLRIRYASDLTALCRGSTATFDEIWRRGAIRDVSVAGVSLFLTRPVDPGTLLDIEPPRTPHGLARVLHARVVHAREETGGWVVGCEFLQRLRPEELQHLL